MRKGIEIKQYTLSENDRRLLQKQRLSRVAEAMWGPFITVVLVFLVSVVLIRAAGAQPLQALVKIFDGAFGTKRALGETLNKMCPLLLCALGMNIAFRSGLSSVGGEGQIMIGGIASVAIALQFTEGASSWIAIPLSLIAGGLGGALWAAIPGTLKATRGTSELVNTVMLNYVAMYFLSYMLNVVMIEPPGYYAQTPQIAKTVMMPYVMAGSRLHYGVLVALLMSVLVYFLLWRTPLGYQLRLVGYNSSAAKYVGLPIRRNIILAMALHGFLSGLAGGMEVVAVQHRLITGFSTSVGFDAIAVSLLGGNHPFGTILSALFLAALRTGASTMQLETQVPVALVSVMQGLIILFFLMNRFVKSRIKSLGKAIRSKSAASKDIGKEAGIS
ncbi:MAG: ABC transporter permease [Bacillota bacterium]